MKALVLAGGRGTRLRPLTHTRNKHLLPIGGKPMIERVIEDVLEAGVEEVIINLNKGDKEIPEALGDGSKWGTKFIYIEQDKPNGMMYPILLAEQYIQGDSFILHAGDNVLSGGLKKYVKEFDKSNCDALVLVTRIQNPERFSVYQVEGKKAIKVIEKPKEYIGDLAGTAIYIYRGKGIFEAMKNVEPILAGNSSTPEYYPPPAHQWMIDNGYTVNITECTGWWKDTGKPEDLINANHLVLEVLQNKQEGEMINTKIEGKVEIHAGAKVIDSTLRGPLVIGANTTIANSYIGPFTSISNNCEIINSEIENSIIQRNVKIVNFPNRIDNSLIGDNATITHQQTKPETTRLFIGDNSEVVL